MYPASTAALEAPIFSVADYGLEADLFDALPKFLEELNKLNTIQK